MRKLLFIAVLLPILGGLGWWYFREQALPDYGPLYREYAYVTNGKSNTVSVIDLRTFALAKTIPVGSEPTGIAANSKKNEIYVVNAGSNNVSVIDAEIEHRRGDDRRARASILHRRGRGRQARLRGQLRLGERQRDRSREAPGDRQRARRRRAGTGAGFAGWLNRGRFAIAATTPCR